MRENLGIEDPGQDEEEKSEYSYYSESEEDEGERAQDPRDEESKDAPESDKKLVDGKAGKGKNDDEVNATRLSMNNVEKISSDLNANRDSASDSKNNDQAGTGSEASKKDSSLLLFDEDSSSYGRNSKQRQSELISPRQNKRNRSRGRYADAENRDSSDSNLSAAVPMGGRAKHNQGRSGLVDSLEVHSKRDLKKARITVESKKNQNELLGAEMSDLSSINRAQSS